MSFLYAISRISNSTNVNRKWYSIEDIDQYYYMGPFLVIKKKVPQDHTDPKIEETNHTILETYSLYDIKTYQKFGLNILKNRCIVYHACKNANLEFLN